MSYHHHPTQHHNQQQHRPPTQGDNRMASLWIGVQKSVLSFIFVDLFVTLLLNVGVEASLLALILKTSFTASSCALMVLHIKFVTRICFLPGSISNMEIEILCDTSGVDIMAKIHHFPPPPYFFIVSAKQYKTLLSSSFFGYY